jgi:hypothetical protein
MKSWCIGFVSLFCFTTFALKGQNGAAESNRIYWNDSYKLEWSDFQSKPKENTSVAALSSIGLPYSYTTDGEGELNVKINVCFIKNESWSKADERNDLLLLHEQIHFDIAELHRRMIVKAMLEANFTKKNYKEKLNEIINQYWRRDYKMMQNRYDKDTNFSNIVKEQINWNKYIAQQLNKLKKFDIKEVELSLINFDEP